MLWLGSYYGGELRWNLEWGSFFVPGTKTFCIRIRRELLVVRELYYTPHKPREDGQTDGTKSSSQFQFVPILATKHPSFQTF